MPRRVQPRLPMAPLIAYAQDHNIGTRQQDTADYLGITLRSFVKYIKEMDGIPFDAADKVCAHLGLHPAEIWGDTYRRLQLVETKAEQPWQSRKSTPQDFRISEKDYMQTIKDLARYSGWSVYHTYDSRRSDPGFPDLVLVRPPRVVFAELKSQRGGLSTHQRDWMEHLTFCPGVENYVWRPSDWPDVVATLEREKR